MKAHNMSARFFTCHSLRVLLELDTNTEDLYNYAYERIVFIYTQYSVCIEIFIPHICGAII